MRNRPLWLVATCVLIGAATRARADDAGDLFENTVRPILAEHCVRCHGDKKQMGGLRLDSPDAITQGGDSGKLVGDKGASLLLTAVRRTGDSPMPPNGPLPPEAIAKLEAWVKAGASLPKPSAVPPLTPSAAPHARPDHWAFKPVKPPAEGASVDSLVGARLAEKGLDFAPPADKRTLYRRLSYNLTGLMPTAAELDAFEADPSPGAYGKLVEKLLASPHYGEKWGRLWLDVARYADTKGYVFQENKTYPYAYTYRDYVIESLNADKPFDCFVEEQLAADLLPETRGGKSPRTLAALGFLTLGRRYTNNQHDIIDDRIDVVTRGLMGVTVQCARCHDHKFDPVSTADYYALYGVFASSTEPKELPLIGAADENAPGYKQFVKDLASREGALAEFRDKRLVEIRAELRKPESVAKYLAAAAKTLNLPDDAARQKARDEQLRGGAFGSTRALLKAWQSSAPPAWLPLKLALQPGELAPKLAKLPESVPAEVRNAVADAKPKSVAELVAVYAQFPSESAILAPLVGPGSPADIPAGELDKNFDRADRDEQTKLQRKIDGFKAASPFAPARAMALVDLPKPVEPQVFVRGNPDSRGAKVARRAPEILSDSAPEFSKTGSGRLELAKSVTNPRNPLTYRVITNRVWAGHFGRGLVESASDFGVRTAAPSHPELLDYLAATFAADGYSLKSLHRRIVTSRAYRQSGDNPAALAADPANTLIGRRTPTRLDFEGLRDNVLLAAGQLDPAVGGRSIDLFAAPFPKRRSVYAFIDRQNLAPTLRTFDFASPDTHSAGRFQTTVPQQALFLMNSPFMVAQAEAVAKRAEVKSAKDDAGRVATIYRAVLGRSPRPNEVELAAEFLAAPEKPGALPPAAMLAQVLLLSNEFAFVD